MDIGELLKTILIALFSSGAATTVITYFINKHSKVDRLEKQIVDIEKVLERHADALEALLYCQMELLNILHEKGLINGESQALRDEFQKYMYGSQAKGLKTKKQRTALND